MIYFRIARGVIALAGSLLPLCVLWRLMLSHTAISDGPGAESRITGPAKASVSLVGPADVLVYADPWFAGTVQWWMMLCCAAAALLVLVAVCVPVRSRSGWSLVVWGLVSLLLGLVFAAPWLYGFFRMIVRA